MFMKFFSNYFLPVCGFFLLCVPIVHAEQISGLASPDSNGNSVPDDLESIVTNNDWYITVDMGEGQVLEWADVLLTSNVAYEDILDTVNPNESDTWQNAGWRFATSQDLWKLFQIFGANSTGPHFNSKHVGTDLSLLLGDLGDIGSSQFTPDEIDQVQGFVDSTGLGGASYANALDLGITANLRAQTNVQIEATPGRPFDLAHPGWGAWLVRGNRPPELTTITNQIVNEGELLEFAISATDLDTGDVLTFSASNTPVGSTFDPSTGVFSWTPNLGEAGTYPDIAFTVTDDGVPALTDSTTIFITVEPVSSETIVIQPNENDGKDTYVCSNANAQSGRSDDDEIRIGGWGNTCNSYIEFDLSAIPPTSVVSAELHLFNRRDNTPNSGKLLRVAESWTEAGVTWSDQPSSVDIGMDWQSVPMVDWWVVDVTDITTDWNSGLYPNYGMQLIGQFDSNDHTKQFWSSDYFVDPTLRPKLVVTYVTPTNTGPTLNPIGNQATNEGQLLEFTVSATDPENDTLTFTASGTPSGATFSTSTATFSWTPGFNASGTYDVTFTVTEDTPDAFTDTETITITVSDAAPSVTLTPTKDSTLRPGAKNRNEGANPLLDLGNKRKQIVGFDLAGVDLTGLTNASLVFTIDETNPAGNWSNSGRNVAAHRVITDWEEGNGKHRGLPSAEATRGTGNGVTWNCTVDTEIEDSNKDCVTEWFGGAAVLTPTDEVLHTNNMTGEVTFDVTADVLTGGTSWMLKKADESKNGNVRYFSKENEGEGGPKLMLMF